MIRIEAVLGLATFALWVYCLIDAIRSADGSIRNLPKLGWILIVLFFPLVGSVAWLVAGRPASSPRTSRFERPAPQYPEYDRPGRASATNPEADEAFLRKVRERAEEQRRAYREQQLRREREERGETDPTE